MDEAEAKLPRKRGRPRKARPETAEPIAPAELRRLMSADPSLAAWHTGRYQNIAAGFYKSQALEWVHA